MDDLEATPNTDPPNGSPLAPGGGRTIEAALVDAKHDAEALELRRDGLPYRLIADRQGCSTSTAFERVRRALRAHVPRESVDEYRKMSAERLEALIGEAAAIAADRYTYTADQRLAAMGTVVRLEGRLSALIGGDTPVEQKVRVRKVDDLDAKIEELVGRMRDRDPAGP